MDSDTLSQALSTLQEKLFSEDALLPEELSFEDLLFLYEMGYQFYATEQYEKAIHIFQRLVVAKPHEAKFWHGLASSQQMHKQFKEALLSWSLYCIIDTKSATPHFHAAECLLSLGEAKEAMTALDAATSRDEAGAFTKKIDLLREVWSPK